VEEAEVNSGTAAQRHSGTAAQRHIQIVKAGHGFHGWARIGRRDLAAEYADDADEEERGEMRSCGMGWIG
jgi:hypothetical protein